MLGTPPTCSRCAILGTMSRCSPLGKARARSSCCLPEDAPTTFHGEASVRAVALERAFSGSREQRCPRRQVNYHDGDELDFTIRIAPEQIDSTEAVNLGVVLRLLTAIELVAALGVWVGKSFARQKGLAKEGER